MGNVTKTDLFNQNWTLSSLKISLLRGLVLVAMGTTTTEAFAQNTTQTNTQTNIKATADTSSGSSSGSTLFGAETGRSTISALGSLWDQWAQPLTLSLKTEVGGNIDEFLASGGAKTDTTLRMGWRFNDQLQTGFIWGGKYPIASNSQAQRDMEWLSSDFTLFGKYTGPSLMLSDKSKFELRLALPTSDGSIRKNKNFQLRGDLGLPYSFENNRELFLRVSGRWNDFAEANSQWEIRSAATASMGKDIKPYVALNHDVKFSKHGSELGLDDAMAGPEAGLEYNPNKKVTLSMSVGESFHLSKGLAKVSGQGSDAKVSSETEGLVSAEIRL